MISVPVRIVILRLTLVRRISGVRKKESYTISSHQI